MSQLGRAIRTARVSQALTIADLSERCGAHPGLIGRLERGYIPARCGWLSDIEQALNMSAGRLDYYHLQDLQSGIVEYSLHDLRIQRAVRLANEERIAKLSA